MDKEKEFWDRIKGGLAEELGLSMPSDKQLEEIAASIEVEPLGNEEIEQILSGGGRKSARERIPNKEREVSRPMIPPNMIAREMALALNRNRGAREPDVDDKVAKLRAEALKKDDDPGDGDAA